MECPGDCKYTKDHEWLRVEGGLVTLGITEFAQSELGEIVFVELPEAGQSFDQGESICVVESTKAASDVYTPVSATVAEANSALEDSPDLVNSSPFEDGWLVKLKGVDLQALNDLMSAEEYRAFVEA